MNNLITILPIIASFFVIISGLYGFYKKVIKPRRIKTKFINLLPLIQEWFDELDCYLEKDLNIFSLQNKEKKIIEYIDKYLKGYTIKPSKKIIRKWNKKMGIKKVIKREIDKIPEEYCKEILNFIKLLERQEKRSNETAILSESSLRKDCKDDEVWKDLEREM